MTDYEKAAAFIAYCKRDYKAYVAYVHHNTWTAGKAVSYICDTVQDFLEKKTGNAYDILVLSMPPQHGKSMTITETLPSWYLVNNPNKRVIEISYSEDFAQLFGRRNRAKLKEYGGLFGIQLANSPNSNVEFETTAGGGMISRGITSGVTGRPCDLMIIDDPVKNRMEADSETYRTRIWDEWQDSFKTRLFAGAKVIIIQTRWHEDDLAGRIIKNEPNVTVLNLPCEAEADDPLGRPVGDALCPEIGKDNKWLADYKKSYEGGSRTWNALYQGHPTIEEGNILQREWWQRYELDELPVVNRVVISVDATFKGDSSSDYVAITVWGKKNADIYLIDMVHMQMDFVKTMTAVQRMTYKYPNYQAIYIEDKANGAAIISVLRRKISRIIGVTPMGGKIARVNAISGIIESGNVWIPKTAWGDAFIDEAAAFPKGAHDDMVDSMSQCLMREYHRDAGDQKIKIRKSRLFSFDDLDEDRKPDMLGKNIRVRAF